MDEIARRVRAARHYAGLTLEDLAARIETSRDTVFRTENELRRTVKQSELNAIAEACGVPRGWFLVPFGWLDEAQPVELEVPRDHEAEAKRKSKGVVVDPQDVLRLRSELASRGARQIGFAVEDDKALVKGLRLRPASAVDVPLEDAHLGDDINPEWAADFLDRALILLTVAREVLSPDEREALDGQMSALRRQVEALPDPRDKQSEAGQE